MKKKLLLAVLAFLVLHACILPVYAAENEAPLSSHSFVVAETNRPGDVDGDSRITSADARLCLRASAKLETLNEKQILSASIFKNGLIDSTVARSILRASAKLEPLHAAKAFTYWTEETYGRLEYTIGPLKNYAGWQYDWYCTTDEPESAMEILRPASPEHNDASEGALSYRFFTCLPKTDGDHKLLLQLKAINGGQIIDEVEITLHVNSQFGGCNFSSDIDIFDHLDLNSDPTVAFYPTCAISAESTAISYEIVNHSGTELLFGHDFTLLKAENGTCTEIPHAPVIETCIELSDNATYRDSIDINAMFSSPLAAGSYILVKDLCNGRQVVFSFGIDG